MSPLRSLGRPPAAAQRRTRLAHGPALGRVDSGPDVVDGTISVTIDAYDGGQQRFRGCRWVSNDALAAPGDRCLVFHEVLADSARDGEADPWVIVWRAP